MERQVVGSKMFCIGTLEVDLSFSHWPLPNQLCIAVKKPVNKNFWPQKKTTLCPEEYNLIIF